MLALPVLLAFLGCSDELRPGQPTPPSGGGDPGAGGTDGSRVVIEPLAEPRVSYDTTSGKTTIVVQFIARDDAGEPLGPEDVRVEMLVDDAALDNESVLQADAEELSSSVHLGLVLDTSYSMLQHTPPAFDPMLEAARDALVQGTQLYANRPGSFTWTLAWFDEVIHVPAAPWTPNDILSIPEPAQGTATKLFGAVEFQARAMLDAYDTIANGPNDHHVLVVFSDGADNYSWFDNSSITSEGQTQNGSPFASAGYPIASRQSAEAAIADHPVLTSHVIGLGSAVNDDDLRALAGAGEGRYFKNIASSEIAALFEQVVQEFATIQDQGATIPLPPGEYAFTLRVTKQDGSGADAFSFAFRAGDEGAGVLD
jgi:hypothetical protein